MGEPTDRGAVVNEYGGTGRAQGDDPRPLFRDEMLAQDEPTVVVPKARPYNETSVLPISQLPDSTGYLAPLTTAPPPPPRPPLPVPGLLVDHTPKRVKRPANWRRRLGITAALAVLVPTGAYLLTDSRLDRVDASPAGAARPAVTPGADWLIVGSDSREGLSKAERKRLATGAASGRRTDMMMLLHVPDGDGKPTLVSLPRDSYVPIAGHGKDRLNAAYAFGGAPLLVQTVEQATGIRIDHYAEIGMGGVFDMVNAVGGVEMCVDHAMNDRKAGLNIKKGCQNLGGAEALGYSRSRNSTRGDLDRVDHQRQLMLALMHKATGIGTLVNPFRSVPLVTNAVGSLKVGEGDHLYDLARLGFAAKSLGSDGVMTTVPIGAEFNAGGKAVMTWDANLSEQLFSALRQDKPVPKSVVRK